MKYDFANNRGEVLSGRLELPAAAPRAFALFAHCFTCSKDFIAASVIAKTLAEMGIGVLRFDFTGLGNSEGDFANTNFSSNVEDLISACNQLSKDYEAPQLLIGHSLGGAAVLKAAAQMKSVKAVVTIAAPSDVRHLSSVFEDEMDIIEKEGQAKITLAGRSFTIKKQFLDDISRTEILDCLKGFRKALLVMHAPHDTSVSIDHAAKIFEAAKHPKSFVTLDNADHLLSKRSDARYAAKVCAAWADRYISGAAHEQIDIAENVVRVRTRRGARFTQDIYTADHHLIADEPHSVQGDNLGLNPYEFLMAGLGACTSMTMKMYADRKEIPLEEVVVDLRHEKIHADDCEQCETRKGKVDKIVKTIKIKGDLNTEQQQRLLEIAEKCPVNRTLKSEIIIESSHK